MTIRKALIFYVSTIVLALALAWLLAYLVAWWVGMLLMTALVIEHAWRVARRIRQNRP